MKEGLAAHDDWRGHGQTSSIIVPQFDQETDYQDSRRRDPWETAYHQGQEDGRRSSRDGPRHDDRRKNIRAISSREDVEIDNRLDSRDDGRINLRDDDRGPSRQDDDRGGPRYDNFDDARHGSQENSRYNSGMNASFNDWEGNRYDDSEGDRYGGLTGLPPGSRETLRQEYPLGPLESRRQSDSRDRRSSSQQEDVQVLRKSRSQYDLEDQRRSGGQKGRKEDCRESREIHPLKGTNSPALPPKPLHDNGNIPHSNRQTYDAKGMDENDFPPACEGNDRADAQDRVVDSGDDEPEESLLSLLNRRRRLSQHNLISTIASGPSSTALATAPLSTSTVVIGTASTTSTSVSTTNPASGENVVCVSTEDSCSAYSFTLGRYKANEFIIHSLQHKDGPFTNKNRLLPDSCRNVIDVLEVWRYGTKTFTAIQDLTEKFGRSWIAPKDRERYQFFTEVVQEFRRLVMDERMDDDMAVKELMGRQEWWLVPLSKQQTDEAAELSSKGEPMETDSDSDYEFQPHHRRNNSQPRKKSQFLKRSETHKRSGSRQKSPAISTDMDVDMDMDVNIGTAAGTHITAAEHSTSPDTEPMDHEIFVASITRPASRNSHRNPRPQYKDNVVEPWGDAVINPNFTFPIPDGIETVPDLYKAWHEGWGGIPSLFQLTKENGPSWRSSKLPSSKKVYEWYHFHYKVIRAVDELVVREWTVEDAILALEQIRGKRKLVNLHKEIPCPGHMIRPIKDKGTSKSQTDNGSPAAVDDINATSRTIAPPTVRPSDSSSTAGASVTNSSRIDSSETVTSDHTTSTATATIVSSSSKTSTISQLKSTIDDIKTPVTINSTPTTSDKSTTCVQESSISSIVFSKFKLTGNGDTTSSTKTNTASNTATGRRMSTIDSISTSSIKAKATVSTSTSAVNDAGDNLSTPIDDGVNATNARISRLMTESNSVPIAKDKSSGSSKLSSVDNTTVSKSKSTTSGNVTSSVENRTFGSSNSNAVENTTAGSPHWLQTATTPWKIDDTAASKLKLATENSILLSTKNRTTILDSPAVANNSGISIVKLTTDRNSTPITNDRPSGAAASSANFNNTAVNPGSSFTYIHNSAKSIQRAMSYSRISSRSSKEPPPKGLTQNDFALSNNSGVPVVRSSFEKDVVPNDSAGSSVGKSNGMTASVSNSSSIAPNGTINRPSSMSAVNASSILADVTAGTVNRPNAASASSDVKSVLNGVNAGTIHSSYNVSAGILDRPRSGSGYTVAPHEYVPRPKEQAETLHRGSRSGTEVTEILESGQVNSTHYTLPSQEATSSRAAVPLPPSLQISKAPYPSSAFSTSRSVDERAVHDDDDDDDDDDERLTRHRPALQRPAPPPPPQQRQHLPHNQSHHLHQQDQSLQQSQQVQYYQRQLLQLQQQRQQHNPQRQQWDRSLDHTRAHSPSQRPSSSSSSSSATSSHHYGHDWTVRHWSSSANDEVIDLT
ncbi:hypothetical protein BGZ47_009683 [Haplosporangium gracile]|nr:hypothetical protein BGZ47_009683 [Haplosporangium gracile]